METFPPPQPSPDLWEQEPSSSTLYLLWGGWDIHWVLMTTSDWQAVIIPWEWGNVQTHWKHDHVSRWHQSPLTTDSSQHCRQWTTQGSRALAGLCNSTLLFPEPSRRKQKVNPRQPKTHEMTQLPITKHNSRTWPAQQVSQAFLARYLSFQQRCCSFFQKCCLLKQTGQIVVEMLRECQSAKCQKDFD